MLNYYPIARLNNNLIHEFLPKIPPDVDLIVAIPRDGILVASLISLYRQIPFTDLISFLEGRIYRPGIKHRVRDIYNKEIKTILLVDDISATGEAMREAKREVAEKGWDIKVYTSVLYAYGGNVKLRSGLLDFYGADMKAPSHYDWTMCDMFRSVKTAFDFDGVLCTNCPPGDDDNGDRYRNFILTVPLKLKPREIGAIITWRRESFRKETEEWLDRYGIIYKTLIMANRSEWKDPIEFKSYHYKNLPLSLMVESSTHQAQEIARLTGKRVLSLASQEMF